ncbi:Uncharacterized protein TCAP_03850 [Tolypocladium capitatum]|uniref:Uncharacterized protein n=1 Tax=Tolypocladium capitatum TaxID=45235 RepID=A0A2K3QFA9_9HYPO|nr:Uncharacterized protein TCAP_03850 [Tolypocladium capitatum]
MFCSSLKNRREWAAVVPTLARSPSPGWKGQTRLETHDIAFPVSSHGGRGQFFRVVLLSTSQVGTPEARDRIERLSLLDGRGKAAVIHLLGDKDGIAAFMKLQMEYAWPPGVWEQHGHAVSDPVSRMFTGDGIPIIPISSAAELPSCLDSLRCQCTSDGPVGRRADEASTSRDLVSHCVRGKALSDGQTNVLSDICGGFGDLAQHAFGPEGQRKMGQVMAPTARPQHSCQHASSSITKQRQQTVFSLSHPSAALLPPDVGASASPPSPDSADLHRRKSPTTMPSQSSDKRRRSPRIVQRNQEFLELCRIQYSIEAKTKMPTIPDSQLLDLHVIRSASFDIDEDDPIDFDPRFFLPGPADKMEEGLGEMRPGDWTVLPPLDYKKQRSSEWYGHMFFSNDCMGDARTRHQFFQNATDAIIDWGWHLFVKKTSIPRFYRSWTTPEGPRGHQFQSINFFIWPRGDKDWRYNPEVPHALGTTVDSCYPADGGILRSELLLAICLLKAQIRQPKWFQDHELCPVLAISFHGRFSARVVQAYYQNGRLVVRPSRLLNLHTPTMSPDVRLLARWLNARPIGNTRQADAETPAEDEGGLVCGLDDADQLHETITLKI